MGNKVDANKTVTNLSAEASGGKLHFASYLGTYEQIYNVFLVK